MTVSELIKFLQDQPQDMQIVYEIFSEQVLLKADKITIKELCRPRPDGWVQDKRPDMETQKYLVFPGN